MQIKPGVQPYRHPENSWRLSARNDFRTIIVHDCDRIQLGTLPTATGVVTRLAYARAVTARIDIGKLLKSARLTRHQIEDQDLRIGVQQQIRFLNLAADSLHDDYLGFHLAQIPDLRELGLLYYVAASAATLGEALRQAIRYTSVVNEGLALRYTRGQAITVSFDHIGVARQSDRHQIEFCMAILIRMSRQLTGVRLVPSRVKLIHHRGSNSAGLAAFFGVDVDFGARADEIVFDKAAEKTPIVSADSYLNELLIGYGEEALARLACHRGSCRAKVENAIAPLLPYGQARAGNIARQLGVSQRTLARLLQAEGTTFSGALEDLRRELARQYLADKSISISRVAWLLGYQEVSAFTHAFRRWTGMTPRQVRSNGVAWKTAQDRGADQDRG
jgi:AraC-like DNA-binding protein